MFGMVRKDQAVAETVREGGVPAGIDDDGAGKAEDYFVCGRVRWSRVLQGKMQAIGEHAKNYLGVITHLAFQVVVVGIRYQQGNGGTGGYFFPKASRKSGKSCYGIV
ncbi:hypothetical protein NSB25_13675 [Acetatifactor muris]|uniref:Uncharacterized protein n=1 Tax=Acetatifactor muris TaxID=879566 RepID=A0A2K4ZI28_9FIRM|nr:hypothetical protein [Acetatifactor muris]MCR2048338.1 hypothetical protein [Acetatifactor muris]SOY30143.1 hypothetical protein AMURIS_02866 [Acetatifactor muris]